MIIDASMQHPSAGFIKHPMFDSLSQGAQTTHRRRPHRRAWLDEMLPLTRMARGRVPRRRGSLGLDEKPKVLFLSDNAKRVFKNG
jgi:hypothetical protein